MRSIGWAILKENIFNDLNKYFEDKFGSFCEFNVIKIKILFGKLEMENDAYVKENYDLKKKYIKNGKIKNVLVMFMDLSHDIINSGWNHREYIYIKENHKDDINNIIHKYLTKI